MNEKPVETMRRAAKLMRERAGAATPGPWERPLDVRNKNVVGAELPADEEPRQWQGGIIPDYMDSGYLGRYRGQRERVGVVQCNTDSLGTHDRKRNGRDLEYIASMDPLVALAVADWLERDAALIDALAFPESDPAAVRYPLTVARAYLGEVSA